MQSGAGLAVARTTAVNALVMGEITYLFNCLHMTRSSLSQEGIFGNRYILFAIALLLVFQMLFTYLPAMQALFGTAGLEAGGWARIVGFGVALMLVVELEK